MERRSNIQQHPHQESRRGYPTYASNTRMKSTPNDIKEFQSFLKESELNVHALPLRHAKETNRYFLPFRDDEDSDERSIYFGSKSL